MALSWGARDQARETFCDAELIEKAGFRNAWLDSRFWYLPCNEGRN
jgi:hypothetical protein